MQSLVLELLWRSQPSTQQVSSKPTPGSEEPGRPRQREWHNGFHEKAVYRQGQRGGRVRFFSPASIRTLIRLSAGCMLGYVLKWALQSSSRARPQAPQPYVRSRPLYAASNPELGCHLPLTERLIDFARDPEVVQQDSESSCHGYDGPLLRVLAASSPA